MIWRTHINLYIIVIYILLCIIYIYIVIRIHTDLYIKFQDSLGYNTDYLKQKSSLTTPGLVISSTFFYTPALTPSKKLKENCSIGSRVPRRPGGSSSFHQLVSE